MFRVTGSAFSSRRSYFFLYPSNTKHITIQTSTLNVIIINHIIIINMFTKENHMTSVGTNVHLNAVG